VSPKQTPIFAAWMLHHFVSGGRNEALEGDLLEELGSGRSSSWYWRQVYGAIAVALRWELSGHRRALLFAAVWSMLSPACLALGSTKAFGHLAAIAQRLDFPWSAICPALLWLCLLHAFLWTGFLLFLLWNRLVTKDFNPRLFREGAVWGTLILLPFSLAANLFNAFLLSNVWLAALSRCVPFFVATLCAIWSMSWECGFAYGHVSIGDKSPTDPPSPDWYR
jgi:hypothetical protein